MRRGHAEERVITAHGTGGETAGAAAAGAIVSLVFERGQRPDIEALRSMSAQPGDTPGFAITHVAPEQEGWAELLSAGLTFDIAGLAPGPSAPQPPGGTLLGLMEAPEGEVVTLAAGPHIEDAPGMLPIVRVLSGLAVRLCALPGLQAVVWQPALCWMPSGYFSKVVGKWLAGGAFPALGLTTLERESDGSIHTRGLALLTGQELRFMPDAKLGAADVARIAVRLIHALIEVDPLEVAHQFTGPDGETIDVAPQPGLQILRVTIRR